MATLIPAIVSCAARMTSGERQFARQLEEKLKSDYLCWYDVSIGDVAPRPDFVVFHPSHGLLVLEVKDWDIDMLCEVNEQHVQLRARPCWP